MARTPSTMLPLGTIFPDFALPDTTGSVIRTADIPLAPGYLVLFICNHCPYVQHIRPELAKLAREYQSRGIVVLAINSNDAKNYPADSPEKMAEEAAYHGFSFPYLYDETQEVARAFRAACTPDIFLFDSKRTLVYRGQFDDSRPGNGLPVTGRDLRRAVDALLENRPISQDQQPSLGCNIKWKPGNEPDYA